MRIFILGDTHCHTTFMKDMGEKAVELECDVIMQVGDFGHWPAGTDPDIRFAVSSSTDKEFKKVCAKIPIPVYFIAGNHEDWDSLERYTENREGAINISENVTYMPTGHSWEWDGVKFLAVGGAYSIDKDLRVEGIDWFPQEMITDEEVELCSAVGKVDVIFSHDTPARTDMVLEFAKTGKIFQNIGDSNFNREQLERVVQATQPSRLYHGHWHLDWVQNVDGVRIECLDCDAYPSRAWTILDTDDIKESK